MEKLSFLQTMALIFMVWEFIKIFLIPKIIWTQVKFEWFKQTKNKSEDVIEGFYKKNLFISYMGYIFLAFTFFLLFSQWWWVSLSLIGLSILTAITLFPSIKDNEPFSSKIFYIMLTDLAFTILLLCQVINPIELFLHLN